VAKAVVKGAGQMQPRGALARLAARRIQKQDADIA